jgi:hypothetical protein
MNQSYFDEIYELCGPDMKEAISNIIKHDRPINRVNYTRVINYLYTLTDDEFRELYINMPRDHEDFSHENNIMHGAIYPYSYVDTIYAIISRSDIIRKCFAISSEPLISCIRLLTFNNRQLCGKYNDLNLESCKLLHEHGCSLSNLFLIANTVLNYESMSYIITNITESDIIDIYNDTEYEEYNNSGYAYNIYYILILNKLKHDSIIFHNRIMKYDRLYDIQMVLQCFYIIKFIPKLDALIFLTNNPILSNQTRDIYKKLLAYHLKPRGSHTKAAITF